MHPIESSRPPVPAAAATLAVRWTARLSSLVITVLVALMLTEGGGRPTAAEAAAMVLFPGGIILGFAIAWWRERLGGLITVGSLVGFYVLMTAMGRFPTGPYFLITAAPGFLFLLAGMIGRGGGRRVAAV